MIKKERMPILVIAILCLLSGLWSGLNRIGWDIVILPITAHHGAIMVGGFLGTLIALEKIIPLKNKWFYVIPVVNGVSVFFFFIGQPMVAIYTLIFTSTALSFVFLFYLRSHRNVTYVLMLIGSLCWVVGNLLLLTKLFYPMAFPWWAAFVLFIIAAERLELMKFLPVSATDKKIFIGILLSFLVGVIFSFHDIGNVICGSALIGISLWLLRNDVIAINLKKKNVPRYVAVSLLAGYISLLFTGIFFFVLSDEWLNYDIIVHSFFIGFVFSMIFAHGPMILPGITGVSATPFSVSLYFWLSLLQISWIIRIFSDVLIEMEIRKISGLLTATAILGYFVTIAVLTIKNQRCAKAF
jgi:hypothetical protein